MVGEVYFFDTFSLYSVAAVIYTHNSFYEILVYNIVIVFQIITKRYDDMFPNLRAEMARIGINNTDIAKTIEASRKTVGDKMKRKSKFTLEEFEKIRDTYFPGMSLDYLAQKKIDESNLLHIDFFNKK